MSRKKKVEKQQIEVEILSLNERGYGVGVWEGKEVQILNTLPTEKIKAEIFKKRRKIYFANVIENLNPLKYRLQPKENHFTSCSPWQILPLKNENEFKKKLIKEFFLLSAETELPDFEVMSSGKEYGYRNKVEFSFYGFDDEKVSLAFHNRETRYYKTPTDGCVLMPDEINNAAQKIIKFINDKEFQARQMKGLLLRYSFTQQRVIASLFTKEKLNITREDALRLLDKTLTGIFIINSDPKSPAFVESEIQLSVGDKDIFENLMGYKFLYPYNGFFQINPPVFEIALKDIMNYCESILDNNNLIAVDLYAGVGSIGISVAKYFKKIIGLEITSGTQKYALDNANNHNNFEFFEGKAEKDGLQFIDISDVLILDPPRAGVHPKVIEQINISRPKYIIYLSCNPKTQAENFNEIKKLYNIKFIKAYNFYPHTPHVENLIILERII